MIELIALYLTLSIAEQQAINQLACAQKDVPVEYQFEEGFHRETTVVFNDDSKLLFTDSRSRATVFDAEGKEIIQFDY